MTRRPAGIAIGVALAWSLACSSGFRDFELAGVAGGKGIVLDLQGDLAGKVSAEGVDQDLLDAEISFPAASGHCAGESLMWRHRDDPTAWNLVGCGPGRGLRWSGAEGAGVAVRDLQAEFLQVTGELYLAATLEGDPYTISARLPLPLPDGPRGSVTGTAVWTCFCGGDQEVEVGRSNVELRWSFNPAISREWTGRGRG